MNISGNINNKNKENYEGENDMLRIQRNSGDQK
jgi:hypothetical protein